MPRLPRRSCAASRQVAARRVSTSPSSASARSRSRTRPAASACWSCAYWSALAHIALGAQLRQRAARNCHRARVDPRPGEAERLELVDEAELQVAPFPHRLALLIALLPAVDAVPRGAFALVRRGGRLLGRHRARARRARTRRAPRGCDRGIALVIAPMRWSARGRRRPPRASTGGARRDGRRSARQPPPDPAPRVRRRPWRGESSRLCAGRASARQAL